MNNRKSDHYYRDCPTQRRERSMYIPPWLSLSQRLRDSAVRVEILRDTRDKQREKIESENGSYPEEPDRELMLAEIAYRDNLMNMEAAIRSVRKELKKTRIPVTPRTSLQRHHSAGGSRNEDTNNVYESPGQEETPTPSGLDDSRWQKMADELGEPVIVTLVKVSTALFDREYVRAVVESLASDGEKAAVLRRYTPCRS